MSERDPREANGSEPTDAAATEGADTAPQAGAGTPTDAAATEGADTAPQADTGTPTDAGDRRPLSVYGVGTDPDVRFSLANERTALAWVRTGLSLVAGGVALTTLAAIADLPWILDLIALIACLAGGALAASALFSWRRVERALRLDRPLPAPAALPWLVGGVVVLALVLAGYAVFELGRSR